MRLTTKQALLLMAGLAVMIGAGVPKAQADPSDQQLQLNYRYPERDRSYFGSSFHFAGLRAEAWHGVEDAVNLTYYEKGRVGEFRRHETFTFIAGNEKSECRFFQGTHPGLSSSESGAKGHISYSGYCYRTPGPGAPCHCGKTVWCRDQPCQNEPYSCSGPYGSYSDQSLEEAGRKACGCD